MQVHICVYADVYISPLNGRNQLSQYLKIAFLIFYLLFLCIYDKYPYKNVCINTIRNF